MNCPQCQVEVQPQSGFCHKCGAPLNEWDPAQAAPQTASSSGRDRLTEPVADRRDNTPETEIWTGSYSPKAMIGWFIVSGLVGVALLVVGMFYGPALIPAVAGVVVLGLLEAGVLAYRRMSVHYRLTNHRFFHEQGILRRVANRLEVIDIDDVAVEQGVVERALGVGTLRITSSDRTHPELRLPGIDNVRKVADLMDQARRSERMRRGIHIESI